MGGHDPGEKLVSVTAAGVVEFSAAVSSSTANWRTGSSSRKRRSPPGPSTAATSDLSTSPPRSYRVITGAATARPPPG